MSTELTSKQPAEAYFISFDFADTMGTITIASVTSVIALDQDSLADVSLTVLDSTKQTNTTTVVYVWVRAGSAGHRYVITCKVVGSDGGAYELEGILPIEETPSNLATGLLITAPKFEPITLAEAKLHLRVDSTVVDDDDTINAIITAAREHVEDYTRRHLTTQTWDFPLQGWPDANYVKLPGGNLQSVTSIKWKDTDGVETTMVTADYIVETNGEQCGRVVLPYCGTWPSGTLYPSNPITVRYTGGWTSRALVPSTIKAAIKLICADMFVNREGQVLSSFNYQENRAVKALLASSRLYDEF